VTPAPIRTLLVDDSEAFLDGARDWLAAREGFTVVGTARSGTDALEAIERLEPDLVLLDLVMPGLDGFQVTRRIKARPDPPWVVIITFHASNAARQEATAAGADGMLSKVEFLVALEPLIRQLAEEDDR